MEASEVFDFHSSSAHQTNPTINHSNNLQRSSLSSFPSLFTPNSELKWDNFNEDPYLDTYLDIANNFLTINERVYDVGDDNWPESVVGNILSETNNGQTFEDQKNQVNQPFIKTEVSQLTTLPTTTNPTSLIKYSDTTLSELLTSSISTPTPSLQQQKQQQKQQDKQHITMNQEEPWRPSVAQKILAVNFTPLYLRSEYLATQIALDEFQSIAIKETIDAFWPVDQHFEKYNDNLEPSESCPNRLVSACVGVRSYRKLPQNEKATLLMTSFFDVAIMKGCLGFDLKLEYWKFGNRVYTLKDIATGDPRLQAQALRIIQTFPEKWKKNFTVTVLIYLIMIFNPEIPQLIFPNNIRREQYNYIYLLQRYLESASGSTCDAQEDLYKILVKIEEVQELRKNILQHCETIRPGFSDSSKYKILALVQNETKMAI